MTHWKTLSSETAYETPWIRVRRDEVLNHAGTKMTYSVVETKHPSVFIVAQDKNGNILMQQNYRYSIGSYIWDLPAGHADPEDKDLLSAAKRELLEEAGLASDDWVSLGYFYQATGIAKIPLEIFLAHNVRSVTDERDEQEDITKQKYVNFKTIEKWISEGTIDTTATIAALYLARMYNDKKEKA